MTRRVISLALDDVEILLLVTVVQYAAEENGGPVRGTGYQHLVDAVLDAVDDAERWAGDTPVASGHPAQLQLPSPESRKRPPSTGRNSHE
jgi:hypothetical protein